MGFHFNGDMQPIDQIVDDGVGHLSFLINIDGDLLGSTHNGTVRADGPVFIVSEQCMDGGANYFSQTNGNIYQWRVQAGSTAGAHWVIELEQRDTTYSAQSGVPADTSAVASLRQAATEAGRRAVAPGSVVVSRFVRNLGSQLSRPRSVVSDSAVTASGGEDASSTTDSPEG
jgi:hypothetical protein